MRSSTSSSSGTGPRAGGRVWQDAAHFAFGVFVCLALAAAAYLTSSPAARAADIVTHREPPDASFYLAHNRGGHVDHHVLYHGIDDVAWSRLRDADVLFLGNSRMMFALPSAVLRPAFSQLGLSYYVLGFGHEEQDVFPLDIIRRENLRPAVVVVNADEFFVSDSSDWAARVVDETGFDAFKVQFEAEVSHAVRRALHTIVPHYVDIAREQREFVIYRSREDGTWFVATDFGTGSAFEWPRDDREDPAEQSLRIAEAFKREIESRGARLVLMVVPGPPVSLHRARVLADHLDVPLVVPDAGNLHSIDGSHLSDESSRRVAQALMERLRPLLR